MHPPLENKSKSKFEYMREFARRNSQKSKNLQTSQISTVSDLLQKFKSNKPYVPNKGSFGAINSHRNSNNTSSCGVPFTIVQKNTCSSKNSNNIDCQASSIKHCFSLKSMVPKKPMYK